MKGLYITTALGVVLLLSLCGCGTPQHAPMRVSSSAFVDGERIPTAHTCDGSNMSPPLQWSAPPDGTRSLALIMDDPDARGWVHWVLFDLPPDLRSLPEGVPPDAPEPAGGVQGKGTAVVGYFGPCPPEGGGSHRYSFRVYALDSRLGLGPGATKEEVEAAMRGHVLSSGELVGTYSRT